MAADSSQVGTHGVRQGVVDLQHLGAIDPETALKDISCPVLVVAAREDDMIAIGDTRQIVSRAPSAKLVEINAEGQLAEGAWEKLDAADAIVFGTPTYMGGPSAPFKVFADASVKVWFSQGWKDKLAGGFTCSLNMSGDKFSTLMYFVTFAMQHGMLVGPRSIAAYVNEAWPAQRVLSVDPITALRSD